MVVGTWAHVQFIRRGQRSRLSAVRRAHRRSVLALLGLAGAAAVSLPIIATSSPGGVSPDLRADPVEAIEGPQVYGDTPSGLGSGPPPDPLRRVRHQHRRGAARGVGQPAARRVRRSAQRRWASGRGAGTFASSAGPADVRHLRDGRRPQPLPPQQGDALLALEPGGNRPGRARPRRSASASTTSRTPRRRRRRRTPRSTTARSPSSATRTSRARPTCGWAPRRDGATSTTSRWPSSGSTSPAPRPGATWWAPRPTPTTPSGRAAARRRATSRRSRAQQVTVPGWTAQPVNLAQTGAAQVIPLSAAKFGSQGDSNLRYQVTSAPANGTLNVAVGPAFSASTQVVYTPTPGYRGGDGFTYVAHSISSGFPLPPSRQRATVSLASTEPSVAISGAPASMIAGTSVQLTAALANLPGGVAWGAQRRVDLAGRPLQGPGHAAEGRHSDGPGDEHGQPRRGGPGRDRHQARSPSRPPVPTPSGTSRRAGSCSRP